MEMYFPDTVGQPGRSAETSLPLRGSAYGRWAEQVMNGLELPRAMVLGVSMGGFIAGKLAQHAPQRVERLSLWVPGGLVTSGLLPGLRLGMRSLLLYLFPSEARMEALYDELFTDRDESWFRFYQDSLSSLNMERRMPEIAGDEAYAVLEAPVQLLANSDDVIFPPEALIARGRELFPRLIDAGIVEGYRHVPPLEAGATDAVLARIRDFLLGRLD